MHSLPNMEALWVDPLTTDPIEFDQLPQVIGGHMEARILRVSEHIFTVTASNYLPLV